MLKAWVKNVYSLCVEGVTTRAQSYTGSVIMSSPSYSVLVQPTVLPIFVDTLPTTLYTAKNALLPQINAHLYTLSTGPIITKTIEKIRKDS